jgi:hypothetical protein
MKKKTSRATTSLIIGGGEIGLSLRKVIKDADIRDVDDAPWLKTRYDILHICFPYSDKFVTYVKKYQRKYSPKYIVIHSTVPVGTTSRISLSYHSPVRGIHPHLERGLRTFVKYLAPKNKFLANYFKKSGITIKEVDNPRTTEAMKLWCTTQYGVNVAVEKLIYKWCIDNKVDFGIVYTDCNTTYNEGYKKMGFPKFSKYVLDHREGPIGGHCILPNCELLNEEVSKFILENNAKFKMPKVQKNTSSCRGKC